jgi:squalene-associated FAD-dependent desaturase
VALGSLTAYDIVVVGGGCAGLSAAVRLTQHGARVLVVEARGRLGGRATAFRDRETGELVDNGQHVLLGCYADTLAFLHEIGADDYVRMQRQLGVTMIDRDGRRTRLECPRLPSPLHLLAGVLDWDALDWRDRWSVLQMAGPIRVARRAVRAHAKAAAQGRPGIARAQPLAASPGETVQRWLERNGQTPRIQQMLWEPLALAALNQPASTAAAPVFAQVLGEMLAGDDRSAAIILPTRPLDRMYAEPARAYIEQHGGQVLTGAPATIRISNGRAVTVRVGTDDWSPAAAVSAVPWHACASVFDGDTGPLASMLNRASTMHASPIVTVNLWFSGDHAPDLGAEFVGLPGRTMQWVFDKRGAFGGDASHLSLVCSGAADVVEWPNDRLVPTALQELRDAVPAFLGVTIRHATVIREPRATFSLALGEPPRPSTTTDVENLFLAGDWVDTGLPATIESAVRSGHLAAAAALASCS